MTRSRMCKRITSVLVMFAFAAVSTPAVADDVLPGIDLFKTPPGSTSDAFNTAAGGTALPAGFFEPGSDPFTGVVNLQGNPLGGAFGMADTIVERQAIAPFPMCPFTAPPIPIEIKALDLVSSSPITVTFNGGQNPELWDVRVCLSDLPQPQGTMTINHTHSNGGTFDSSLPVQPKFIFTPVVPGPPPVVLDTGVEGLPPDVLLVNGSGCWVHVPNSGFGITVVPAGQQVDGNCNGILDPPLPGTSNFVPGVNQLQSDCATPPGPNGQVQTKKLTEELAMLAAHGILPAEEGLIDCCLPDGTCTPDIDDVSCISPPLNGTILPSGTCTAPEACCLPDDTCIMADPACCTAQGGMPQGPGTTCKGLVACCFSDGTCQDLDPLCCVANGGTPGVWGSACQGDNNGNGIDDACEEIIPAISNYGLVALLLLTAVAGVIVIRRSRRGHAAA